MARFVALHPRAIRVSGALDLLIDGFLKKFPSNLNFALVGVKKFLESLVSEDAKEVAAFLVSEDVLRE